MRHVPVELCSCARTFVKAAFYPRRRTLIGETGKWDTPFLTQAARLGIEKIWMPKMREIDKERKRGGKKVYILPMFPYPSGKLHMGHVRVYTISDTLARYHRLRGRDVIHPIGWDSFGLPAENAARSQGVDPAAWTEENIEIMREQLSWLCFNFDWERELSTCQPKYYKWTQWLFCQLMRRGLAYRKEALVNWDPVDETVLADEQVDDEGRSWRSGAIVEKRPLMQWYIKTTAYAEELYDALKELNYWKVVGGMQKWWMGKPIGTSVEFDLVGSDGQVVGRMPVHVGRPEALFGAAFIVLAPSHFEACKRSVNVETRLDLNAVVPLTGARLPVFVSPDFPFKGRSFGRRDVEALVGCPALYTEDADYAARKGLEFTRTIFDGLGDEAVIVDCHPSVDGLTRTAAVDVVLRGLRELGRGGHLVSSFLGDWLVSRQRYWGTPIPVIHCPDCGAVPVPKEQLPVELPPITDSFTGVASAAGSAPLENAPEEWLKVDCPRCGKAGAERETDTMDTFVDSTWYYLRYLDPNNEESLCDKEKSFHSLPVDVYVGGKEHATLHLFYARFMHRFLRDLGLVDPSYPEPFYRHISQGMVTGQSFALCSTGEYVHPRDAVLVNEKEQIYRHRETDQPLRTQFEKMSKSKLNGIDPQECVEMWGCDTTRLCTLFNGPPEEDLPWSLTSSNFKGTINWQRRMWVMETYYLKRRSALTPRREPLPSDLDPQREANIRSARNDALVFYERHFESSFKLQRPIHKLIVLTNVLRKLTEEEMGVCPAFEMAMAEMVIMLCPMAPMFAAEMWRGLASVSWRYASTESQFDWSKDVWEQTWPEVDEDHGLAMDLRVNDRLVGTMIMPSEQFFRLDHAKADALVREHALPRLADWMPGGLGEVKKTVFQAGHRYEATVNIIMNSVPTIDSDEISGKERPQKKKKKGKLQIRV